MPSLRRQASSFVSREFIRRERLRMRLPYFSLFALMGTILYMRPTPIPSGGNGGSTATPQPKQRRGCAFIALPASNAFTLETLPNQTVLTSREIATDLTANEVVVSWNADAPEGTGNQIQARARLDSRWTRYYML